jgi:MFS family permease
MSKRNFSWKLLLTLPWAYLMLPATQLLQSGAAGGFSTSSADIIFLKGYTEEVAGYLSTAQKILPIVLSPVLGLVIDKYGHRFHYVAAAPILWIIACSLLGFTDVHPTAALVFSSLAGVINSMPLQICIPLLVADQAKIGTAFGVWRAFNNSGSTIVRLATDQSISIQANSTRWMLSLVFCKMGPKTTVTTRFCLLPLALKLGLS